MSTGADLIQGILERLDALEASQTQPQSEALNPTYLTTKPDGTIGANFTGHVHAQGLDLDAGTNNTPPSQDHVRWLRTTDGAVVASLFGSSFAGEELLSLAAQATAQADTSLAQLVARDDQGTDQIALGVSQTNRGSGAITAGTDKVVDSLGHSGFAFAPDQTHRWRIGVFGYTDTFPGGSQVSNGVNISGSYFATANYFAVAPNWNPSGIAGVMVPQLDIANSILRHWSNGTPGAGTQVSSYIIVVGYN